MPYLQLDVPNHYPIDVKRGLARRLGDEYAHIMQTRPDLVTVAFRELGEGGVWCCSAGEREPAALLSCDIRRGRPPDQRAELAQALIDACVETLGLRSDRLAVEFTQHTSDEMYRHGRGWGTEWTPAGATSAAKGRRHACSEETRGERRAILQGASTCGLHRPDGCRRTEETTHETGLRAGMIAVVRMPDPANSQWRQLWPPRSRSTASIGRSMLTVTPL